MDKKDIFNVKDDEEQKLKLQDICELLLAAGYFRARLKGLSAFDKVVGGMVWCLEMCTIDIDIDFLFRENLNIGEKIEITEKIVKVLLTMKCPYVLEPHQIQGLDSVHILPVVQWLVKQAMETREALRDHLKAVTELQYNKIMLRDLINKEKSRNKPEEVRKLFLPHRKFKKKIGFQPISEDVQIKSTLMEYGHAFSISSDGDIEQESKTILEPMSKPLKRSSGNQALVQCVTNLIHQQTPVISQALQDYTSRRVEREGEKDEIVVLENKDKQISEEINKIDLRLTAEEEKLNKLNDKWRDLDTMEESLAEKRDQLAIFDTEENQPFIETLKQLIDENEKINLERKEFKKNCQNQMEKLQSDIENIRNAKVTPEEEYELNAQLQTIQEQLSGALKILVERNMNISKLQRQLDSIPGDSELNQYYRRFTELCDQVNDKQTELNGYYLLYNTLEDTKTYLNKELSLLTSIQEKFPLSMQNANSKNEFFRQMESILAAVRQNKSKLESQLESLSLKQENLRERLSEFANERQHYRHTLKLLSEENQKYKQLISQLNAVA